jgi:hypothetical protein
MTIVILVFVALALPVSLLYLTVSTNEFEKSTRILGETIAKRYIYEPPMKAGEGKSMKPAVKPQGKA